MELPQTQMACPDKRVYLKMKKSMVIPSPSSSGDYGIGVYKFTARNSDGTLPATYNASYACTDFPIFRFADAYLMYAEAVVRGGGDMGTAVNYVNEVRDRAYQYGNYGSSTVSGRISAAQLTLPFLLNERGREFYYEAQRRTDLIRFGQFSNGTYMVLNHSYGLSSFVQLYLDKNTNLVTTDNPWYNVYSNFTNPGLSWGYDFNHNSPSTQALVDSITHFWLSEYKIDGFRFDFTKGFSNTPHGSDDTYGSLLDTQRVRLLERMAALSRARPKS